MLNTAIPPADPDDAARRVIRAEQQLTDAHRAVADAMAAAQLAEQQLADARRDARK